MLNRFLDHFLDCRIIHIYRRFDLDNLLFAGFDVTREDMDTAAAAFARVVQGKRG